MTPEDNLERIELLLALNLVQGKNENESIALLYRAGYNSKEIGHLIGLSDSTVRNRFVDLREIGAID